MSRFKPSRLAGDAVLTSPPPSPPRQLLFSPTQNGPGAAELSPAPAALPVAEPQPTALQNISFYVLLLGFLSAQANEWAKLMFGGKAYLSMVTVVLLPILFLASGGALRGLKHRIGWYWLGLLACILLSTPFSVWRGGSVFFLMNYLPRFYVLLFYICALTVSVVQVRKIVYTWIITDFMLLFTCFKYGAGSTAERFSIPGSLSYGNANELALALVLTITHLLLVMYIGNNLKRVGALIGIAASLFYLLKTGSRGCTLAVLILFFVIFLFSKNKATVAVLTIPLFAAAVLLAPSSSLHRIMSFSFLSSSVGANDLADLSAIQSQKEREQLFKDSISQTVRHPLLGVGPDQFAVAESGEMEKAGERPLWLGTHNSYTQVSSECGIPAFIFYISVLITSLRMTFRMYKQTKNSSDPKLKEIAALAFTLFAGLIVYTVATAFFHMAYSGSLPSLAGTTVALYMASRSILATRTPAAPAASQRMPAPAAV